MTGPSLATEFCLETVRFVPFNGRQKFAGRSNGSETDWERVFGMAPKREKDATTVVELDSDDENGAGPQNQTNKPPPQTTSQPLQRPVIPNYQTLESRSFWRAGDYAVGPTSRASIAQGQLEHARVHPKFLHSNATSHKWAFGGKALCIFWELGFFFFLIFKVLSFNFIRFAAIAELLDNAVDEVNFRI